ncbi:hypothetical protein [uncultured Ruminococcus sp.]|uniref:hypothetical protein n=1 Tax=uncultured Ruminococcus sp. TaxID=165186 RepID=UPI00262A030B|nr:hypothetical protein [uncultured Ruminococcus sp.]
MKTNKKGMTVVEVVVAFAMISTSFAIGMAGIATGASFLNSGARMKHARSNAVVEMTSTETGLTVAIEGSTETFTVVKQYSEDFVQYRPQS